MTDNTVHTQNGLNLDLLENRRLRICDDTASNFDAQPVYWPLAREPVPLRGSLMGCRPALRGNLLVLEVNNDIL